MARYLGWVTLINTALGAAVGAALWLADFPDPLLFGALAAAVNFVPYAGPFVGIAAVLLVSLVTFDSTSAILLPPAAYLAINTLEAYLITPSVLGKHLSLDPVVVFVAVLFWGFLWGVAGAFLAVPLVMSLKIACDQIDGLRPFGALLGPQRVDALAPARRQYE